LPEIGLDPCQYRGDVAPLRRGTELGAFLIDTAEAYGKEDVVGLALTDARNKASIATKVWPTHS